jgi:hypothetical protein
MSRVEGHVPLRRGDRPRRDALRGAHRCRPPRPLDEDRHLAAAGVSPEPIAGSGWSAAGSAEFLASLGRRTGRQSAEGVLILDKHWMAQCGRQTRHRRGGRTVRERLLGVDCRYREIRRRSRRA